MRKPVGVVSAALVVSALGSVASGAISQTINYADPSGLAAMATFTWDSLTPSALKITLKNTSTAVPLGFTNSDQILTSIAFDLGPGRTITAGSVKIGMGAFSVNFDASPALFAGADVSGEWGYGNAGTTGFGSLLNYVSVGSAGTAGFGGTNRDGPAGLDGPQGGLVKNTPLVPLGGLGAIQDCVDIYLTLNGPLTGLGFLANGSMVEFGSDAAFVHPYLIPAPGSALLALGALAAIRLIKRS